MEKAILVMTNVPDTSTALAIGRQLVEKKLAACVSQIPGVRSIYRWQGAIEEAGEITILIKTTQARYSELESTIKTLHPHDVPEIIVLPIVGGFPPYLDWIERETEKEVNVK